PRNKRAERWRFHRPAARAQRPHPTSGPIQVGSPSLRATRLVEEIERHSRPQVEQAKVALAAAGGKSDSEYHDPPSGFLWTATCDTIGNESEWPLEYPPLN